MANIGSAAKRARQIERRSRHNRAVLSEIRTLSKGVTAGTERAGMQALVSAIDKAAKRGILHRNAANRRKARLLRVPSPPK
jgi:small subunit ribosomal protein S20